MSVPALLSARAASEPDHVALLMPDGRSLTVGHWEARANAVAHGLAARGVRPGDRVGLRFGGADRIDYAVGFAAV
jgi:acyl-CoA synthetase (AMP-forming)/AMP-acid ligase II